MACDFKRGLNVRSPRSVLTEKLSDLLFIIEKSRQGLRARDRQFGGLKTLSLVVFEPGDSSARTIGCYVVAIAFAIFGRVA